MPEHVKAPGSRRGGTEAEGRERGTCGPPAPLEEPLRQECTCEASESDGQ